MSELILIAVCTRRRPQMLRQCLLSLSAQQAVSGAANLQILVVENDEVPRAQPIVQASAQSSAVPIAYVQEPQAGLCYARNRALDEALQRGAQWLAFIDDDEVAEPQWIAELYRVAVAHSADVVRGPVQYRYPPEDRWAHLRDTGRKTPPPEGQLITEGATNNVLLHHRLFAENALNLRFDLRLNFVGGEDKLFFLQAHAAGVRMVFAPSARVQETVPLSRCTLRMLWRDKARLAANAILIERDILGVTRGEAVYWQHLRKEAMTALKQGFKCLTSAMRRDGEARRHALKALLALARVQGTWLGLRGRLLESYRDVQGY